jgi:hypothetical protein
MTFRERLADWISGGALTRSRESKKALIAGRELWVAMTFRYGVALQDIINMQTPGANATVRRMARRAQEALGQGASA